ncbi:MAG: hypothetical protein ACM3QX_18260 [Syntrophomonadaceae bacterium]
MALYLSAHLKRMHFAGGYQFSFNEGMLELDDPEMIKVLDSEITLAKKRGVSLGMEKVQDIPKVIEVVPDEVEELKPVSGEPIVHDPDKVIQKLANKAKKG